MQLAVTLVAISVGLANLVNVGEAKTVTLPKEFPVCQRSDQVCLLSAVRTAISKLMSGYPKLGMFPLDPLKANRMELNTGSGSPVSVNLIFTEQDLTGLSNMDVQHTHGDFGDNSYRFEFALFVPTLTMVGDYEINGKVLLLPIVGKGRNNMTLSDFNATLTFTGNVTRNQDGDEHVEIVDVGMSYDSSRLYLQLDNLFNGNKALGDNMNSFLNDNWQDILKEMKRPVGVMWGQLVRELANRIYARIPYGKIHLV